MFFLTQKKLFFLTLCAWLFFGFISQSHAATTYQTPQPQFTRIVTQNPTDFYVARYRIPTNVPFDRVQMAVPSSQGDLSAPSLIYIAIYRDGNDGPFESCITSACVQNDSVVTQDFSNTGSKLNDNTIQFLLNTTQQATNTSQYLIISLPEMYYNGFSGGVGYTEDGYNSNRRNEAPSIKLCDGLCDDNNFNPIPELTSQPFVRITNPSDQATVPYSANFSILTNTGTSSADNVVVTFQSTIASIPSYNYNLVNTGLYTETFTKDFPSVDDTITVQAFIRSGSTTLASTSPITVYTRANAVQVPDIQCNQDNFLVRGFCEVVVFLFYPGDLGTDQLSQLWDDIKYKPPFGYVTTIFEQLNAFDENATPNFSFGSLPFVDDIFTPIKTGLSILLWGFWAIWLYNKRLTKLDI